MKTLREDSSLVFDHIVHYIFFASNPKHKQFSCGKNLYTSYHTCNQQEEYKIILKPMLSEDRGFTKYFGIFPTVALSIFI